MSDKEESSGALGEALKAAVAEAELKTKPEEVSEETVNSEEDTKNKTEASFEGDKPKLDELGRAYATGKRKNAVARVWIKRGSGRVIVNGKDGPSYFARPVLQMIINQPLQVVDRATQYDVWCTVSGGGLSGQAGAVRHGISKALTYFEPSLRGLLKPGGFLTRDSRSVERKKYGKKKARRSFQFSKR
tara:strand:- start:474 stop:1037 length:564 start_codon:yes stop_codon:yes gene_type:complete